MSMSSFTKVITAIRVGIVIFAAGISILTVFYLASIPPPPPESDGFAYGMAAAIGGGIILLSLGLAIIVVITPTLFGRADPIGFNRPQRVALKAAGGLVGLGLVIALVSGLDGVFLLLVFLVLAFAVVCAMLLWRFGEVLRERRARRGVV